MSSASIANTSQSHLVTNLENLNGRVGHLTPEQAAILRDFKTVLAATEHFDPNVHDDHQLLRFLRARKFDIPAAKKMWIDCQVWRKANGVDTIIQTFEFPEYMAAMKFYPRWYHKVDKLGRPVYIEQLGMLDLQRLFSVSSEERMQRNHVHEYERLIKYRLAACSIKFGRHFEQSTVIMDLKNVALSTFPSVYGIVKSVSAIAQDYYPEMLGKMFVINAPMLFTGVWSLVKPMLDEVTVRKIVILGPTFLPALLETIDSENIPRYLGGTCTSCPEGCEHSDIGPWNDGSVEGYPKPEFEQIAVKYGALDVYRHVKDRNEMGASNRKRKASTMVADGRRTDKKPARGDADADADGIDLDVAAFVNSQSVDALLASATGVGRVSKKAAKKRDRLLAKTAAVVDHAADAARAETTDASTKASAQRGGNRANNGAAGDDGSADTDDDEFDAEELAEMRAYEELQAEKKKGAKANRGSGDDEDESNDEQDDAELLRNDAQKVFRNDKPALLAKLSQIRLDSAPGSVLPWIEFQRVTSSEPLDLAPDDAENDLKREMAFYKQALEAVDVAFKELQKADVPIRRPDDFFAEMIKTDEHMALIRQKLVDETNAIAASEKARKLRDAKKFGKKVQVEKLQERQASKRQELEKVAQMRKKTSSGKNNDMSGFEDDFGVSVDREHGSAERVSSGKKGQSSKGLNQKRAAKDHKFGFGGKKRHAKSNTAESTADMRDFNAKKMKQKTAKAPLGVKKGGGVGKGKGNKAKGNKGKGKGRK
ncbi:cytosolic factor, phosphatidylinositol/phosphatidylcholine transfer protein [Entophlyctis luteolus]|nr:cytosolic factor, phosphatidylinositol/phosphatidylcholine transfer protein [Entophlyctis luteolus]